MAENPGPGPLSPGGDNPYRVMVEAVEDFAIFATDPAGRVTHWNIGAERILGYPEGEILGREATIIFTPEDRERGAHLRELEDALVEGKAQDERWHLRKDGSRFWGSGVVVPLRDEQGNHLGFGKIMRDLTAWKRVQQDLAASEARFRAIAEQTPVLIWRSGVDGGYDYFNRPWYDFRGRSAEEELASAFAWTEGIHPDDREGYLEAYRDAFARRAAFEHTFRLRRRDGMYRWVVDRGSPYFDAAGEFRGYLGSCLDITERVEFEKTLDQQRELAEEASRNKARLLSALSHDARTPLNAVVLSALDLEMCLKDRLDPEVDDALRTIRHSISNVLDLLGDLLNLARIDSGTVLAEPSRFELGQALEECLSGIKPQARQKGLELRLEPGGLASAVLETDRLKLKQILSNLLSNALRYTERGSILVRGGVEADADQFRIAVEDTGIGIAPDDRARVFEEFARLDNPHRPSGEGTGLGLAICRRLASLLGGEITLESEPGRGSTFSLVLPASILTTDAPPAEATPGPGAEAEGSGAILIAEDHLAGRQMLARILRRMGYRVLEAANGRDALEQVQKEAPLLVLMDVNMPVMDGIEATLALRADPKTRPLPIYALTGDVSLVNRQRIGEAGVDGFLEKPVDWDALRRTLDQVQGRQSG